MSASILTSTSASERPRRRYDSSTGLLNSRSFLALLDRRVAQNTGHGRQRGGAAACSSVALLVLELRDSEDLDQRLGRRTAAALMSALARRLELAARPGDLVAVLRQGRLALALNDVGELPQARVAAGRIAGIVGQALSIRGQWIDPAISWGIALAESEYEGAGDLLGSALLGLRLQAARQALRIPV